MLFRNLLDRTSGALQCRKLRVRRKKVASPQDLTRSCQNISIWENIQENRKFYSAVPTYWFEGWFMGTIPVDQYKPYNFAAKIWAFENVICVTSGYSCLRWCSQFHYTFSKYIHLVPFYDTLLIGYFDSIKSPLISSPKCKLFLL